MNGKRFWLRFFGRNSWFITVVIKSKNRPDRTRKSTHFPPLLAASKAAVGGIGSRDLALSRRPTWFSLLPASARLAFEGYAGVMIQKWAQNGQSQRPVLGPEPKEPGVRRQRLWDRFSGLKNGGFLAHRNHRGVEMSQKSGITKLSSERIVKDIRRATRNPSQSDMVAGIGWCVEESMSDPKLIQSALSRTIREDGNEVRIDIYRLAMTDWSLEVVDETGASTVWDDLFPTDQAGFRASYAIARDEPHSATRFAWRQ
jgi:hypothetical protein